MIRLGQIGSHSLPFWQNGLWLAQEFLGLTSHNNFQISHFSKDVSYWHCSCIKNVS